MCGIVGYVTLKPRAGLANFMWQGLIVDSLRGMCGTGIYAFDDKAKESLVWKRALAGTDFVNTMQFDQYKDNVLKQNLVIGHNRASTIGSAKDKNCHPFVFDHIGLVHNGTLRNYYNLFKHGEFTHDVDSAYAARAFAKYGAVEALEQIEGAFVFVWHDMQANTFNIARNGMRDIWYITDKEGENLYYASEYEMLAWLLERNGLETHGKYRSPAEFTLCSWDISKSLSKPKIVAFEEFKPKPVAPYKGGMYNSDGYYDRWKSRDAEELQQIGLEQYEKLEIVKYTFEPYSENSGGKGRIEGLVKSPDSESGQQYRFRLHGCTVTDKNAIDAAEKAYVIASSMWYEGQDPVVICKGLQCASKSKAGKEDGEEPVDMFPGPAGLWFTEAEFLEETKHGCCYCSDPIGKIHAKELKWVRIGSDDAPICAKCASDPAVLAEVKLYQNVGGAWGYWD